MENISTAVICVIIAVICVYAIISYRKKLKNGCCGVGDTAVKIKSEDTNKSHYTYKTVVFIDGMSCGHCSARVENAFNAKDGCFAEVDLQKKCAVLWTHTVPDESEIKETVEKSGYTFVKTVNEK